MITAFLSYFSVRSWMEKLKDKVRGSVFLSMTLKAKPFSLAGINKLLPAQFIISTKMIEKGLNIFSGRQWTRCCCYVYWYKSTAHPQWVAARSRTGNRGVWGTSLHQQVTSLHYPSYIFYCPLICPHPFSLSPSLGCALPLGLLPPCRRSCKLLEGQRVSTGRLKRYQLLIFSPWHYRVVVRGIRTWTRHSLW